MSGLESQAAVMVVSMTIKAPRLKQITLLKDRVADWDNYPFNIPVVRSLSTVTFTRRVSFFVGENGSGK